MKAFPFEVEGKKNSFFFLTSQKTSFIRRSYRLLSRVRFMRFSKVHCSPNFISIWRRLAAQHARPFCRRFRDRSRMTVRYGPSSSEIVNFSAVSAPPGAQTRGGKASGEPGSGRGMDLVVMKFKIHSRQALENETWRLVRVGKGGVNITRFTCSFARCGCLKLFGKE